MKKRDYRAQVKVDPIVTKRITQHSELRAQFEQSHPEFDELGATNVDQLRAEITEVESANALSAAARGQLQAHGKNVNDVLKWTSRARWDRRSKS
jgi:hypothetical protein